MIYKNAMYNLMIMKFSSFGNFLVTAYLFVVDKYQSRVGIKTGDSEIRLAHIPTHSKLNIPSVFLRTSCTCNNILLLSLQLTESAVAKAQCILDDLLRG